MNKTIKTLNWNLGLLIIRIGYLIRGEKEINPPFKLHESVGRRVLQFGYWLRGQIPMKTFCWAELPR